VPRTPTDDRIRHGASAAGGVSSVGPGASLASSGTMVGPVDGAGASPTSAEAWVGSSGGAGALDDLTYRGVGLSAGAGGSVAPAGVGPSGVASGDGLGAEGSTSWSRSRIPLTNRLDWAVL
jgi:hypothetical protein